MNVDKHKNGLLITPETDFEEQVLLEMFPRSEDSKHTVFIKSGITPADIVGLKIVCKDKE